MKTIDFHFEMFELPLDNLYEDLLEEFELNLEVTIYFVMSLLALFVVSG